MQIKIINFNYKKIISSSLLINDDILPWTAAPRLEVPENYLEGLIFRQEEVVRLKVPLVARPNPTVRIYKVFCPLSRDVLKSFFDMFHRPLGWYCSYCAAQLVTGTYDRKQNITTEGTKHTVVMRPLCNF